MSDGNGADLSQVLALLGDMLITQQGMQEGIRALDRRMDQFERRMDQLERRMDQLERRMDQFELRLGQLERQVERQIDAVKHQVAELSGQVAMYHGAVVGHGVLISELDGRVGRVERHLELPPAT